ncbi:Cystathionine gamma-lyase [Sporomusa rhizae]|uniref:trans-sulfuration enzyme family protein n=1 Tax=Sporomusa rhizae TaxID=357999 RepID=UPI00352BA73C
MEKVTVSPDTEILYQGGQVRGETMHPETPPLYMSTAYIMKDLDELHETNSSGGYSYNRTSNPNRDCLADVITSLENGQGTIICSSGMAAISLALLTYAKQGDHILASLSLYGESIDLLDNVISRYGIQTTYVDFTDLEAVRKAVRPNTVLFYTEVIANPLTTVVNIKELSDIAHQASALVLVDSTFTTPFLIKPIVQGADVVIHSLTKYFGGHSDVTAGSITTATKELLEKVYNIQVLFGCCSDPFAAWLCLRSVRTMSMRVKQQMSNAEKLAAALQAHPRVLRVNHPSLPGHPQHELAKNILTNGYGAIMSFSVADDRQKLNEFMHALRLVKYLPTLGGYRTTLSHPVSSSHMGVPEEVRLKMGIHEGLMRISVGIEDIDDLIADFTQALNVF